MALDFKEMLNNLEKIQISGLMKNSCGMLSVPAEIVDVERYVTSVQGSTVQLSCMVDGLPQPTVIWQKDFLTIFDEGRHQNLGNGTLIISNVKVRSKLYIHRLFQISSKGPTT